MAKKPDITTIASGYYSRQALNNNFESLRDKFDNTLSLDGSTPNAMNADLDLNGNNIIGASGLLINGTDYLSEVESAKAAALVAQAAAELAENNAELAENNAETAETNAGASETAAGLSATAAATSATASQTAQTAAELAEINAETAETNAETAETNAAASAAAALASETAAGTSETNAALSEAASSTSETNAAASAAAASTSETNTAASETNAATSETNAANSATASASSATASAASAIAASASETAAAASEAAASTSETNAAASETAAASSETAAASSASSASTSASNAASSASSASASADAALAALDNFDDRYLGQKTSDPATDNDGDALVSGALYFNITDEIMKVYEGGLWVAAYASLSGAMFGANNLSDVADAIASRTNLGLGTAAITDSTDYATAVHTHIKSDITDFSEADYATAAQGALADTAIQPADLATVATTGDYNDLINTPSPFDPNTLATVATTGSYNDLINIPANIVTDAAYVHTDNNYTTAEQSKLAGIEAGATADQTAAEILTAIKTVDGSGSGLDADKLDGQHGSYYYPASNPNGYITSAPAPSSAQVGSATAGLSAGAVGTYAFARSNSTDLAFNGTRAGSTLNTISATSGQTSSASTVWSFNTGSALSGTWRVMGTYDYRDGGNDLLGATLWLRIS